MTHDIIMVSVELHAKLPTIIISIRSQTWLSYSIVLLMVVTLVASVHEELWNPLPRSDTVWGKDYQLIILSGGLPTRGPFAVTAVDLFHIFRFALFISFFFLFTWYRIIPSFFDDIIVFFLNVRYNGDRGGGVERARTG